MGREFEERNRAAVDRLRAVGARLSDDELTQLIDPPWSAAALFAHIAFWDRFAHARWLLTVNTENRTPPAFEDALLELINHASLGQWAAIPPRTAVQECLAGAAEINAFIGSLEPDVVSEVVQEGRERLVDRSLHRGEHLKTIEMAFPSS